VRYRRYRTVVHPGFNLRLRGGGGIAGDDDPEAGRRYVAGGGQRGVVAVATVTLAVDKWYPDSQRNLDSFALRRCQVLVKSQPKVACCCISAVVLPVPSSLVA
jgi:hypothetical protein